MMHGKKIGLGEWEQALIFFNFPFERQQQQCAVLYLFIFLLTIIHLFFSVLYYNGVL